MLGEEQPGKIWGSSFSIPTSGLSERGKGLRRERKRAPAEGRQLRVSWRLRKGEEAQGGGTQRKEGNHEWRGVRRGYNQNCLRRNQLSSGDKTIPAGKYGDKEFEHNLANYGKALKLFIENIRFALKESREQRGDMGPSRLLQ